MLKLGTLLNLGTWPLEHEKNYAINCMRETVKMTATLTKRREQHQEVVEKEILAAVEFELVGSIAHAGGVLTGFSVKFSDSDCLMTLRAVIGSRPMVSFVGCPDLSSCFRKAVVEAYHDGLKWRKDEFARMED